MSTESPFTISVKTNLIEGYSVKKCVECSSDSFKKTFQIEFNLIAKPKAFTPIYTIKENVNYDDSKLKEVQLETEIA